MKNYVEYQKMGAITDPMYLDLQYCQSVFVLVWSLVAISIAMTTIVVTLPIIMGCEICLM
jgi:hypothetical protein